MRTKVSNGKRHRLWERLSCINFSTRKFVQHIAHRNSRFVPLVVPNHLLPTQNSPNTCRTRSCHKLPPEPAAIRVSCNFRLCLRSVLDALPFLSFQIPASAWIWKFARADGAMGPVTERGPMLRSHWTASKYGWRLVSDQACARVKRQCECGIKIGIVLFSVLAVRCWVFRTPAAVYYVKHVWIEAEG